MPLSPPAPSICTGSSILHLTASSGRRSRSAATLETGLRMDGFSVVISALALAVSALTAWFTLLRKGHVRMTQPTVIYLGPDGPPGGAEVFPKVFLRCLLYSTGRRGRVIESMFVRLRRGESAQTFNVWVHGDTQLRRGSGMFIGWEGVVTNHHFLLPEDGTTYEFLPGEYRLDVWVSLVGSRSPERLFGTSLSVTDSQATSLREKDTGLYFDWGPDSQRYHAHARKPPVEPVLANLLRKGVP